MATIGRYELTGELGRGGAGVVYRARDPRLGRDVAIKVLLQATPAQRERIAREGRALARLDHPGIVRVLDSGETPERAPWVALELVTGGSLQARLERDGPLPVAEAVAAARAVAEALAHAHAQGVVHRDVKPGNILVGQDGAPRLGDFGLVKDLGHEGGLAGTVRGQVLGTPGFWAPEQALGEPERIGPPADVYGLGATLYALLTGGPPHEEAETLLAAIAAAQQGVDPPSRRRPEVDPALDALVVAALALDPAARPTASEVARRLERWLLATRQGAALRPAPAPGAPAGAPPGPPRLPAPLAGALVAGLAALAAGGGALGMRGAAREAAARAARAEARVAEAGAAAAAADARHRAAQGRAELADARVAEAEARVAEADARAARVEERAARVEADAARRAVAGRTTLGLLAPAVERELDALLAVADAAGRPALRAGLRLAALGRPWGELAPWADEAGTRAPRCAATTLLRARLAAGRDAYDPALAALDRARALGADPAEVDVLVGRVLWFRGEGNAAARRWDAVAGRAGAGPWGAVALRLSRAARGVPTADPLPRDAPALLAADAALAAVLLVEPDPTPEGEAVAAAAAAVVARLGALDAELLLALGGRRLAAAPPAERDAALAACADVLPLVGASAPVWLAQVVATDAEAGPAWLPSARRWLDDAARLEPDRADVSFVRGAVGLVAGEPPAEVLAAWRRAFERDPRLLPNEAFVAEFRRRHGDTPALREVLAARRR